jgi:biopolymer transport protein ExbB
MLVYLAAVIVTALARPAAAQDAQLEAAYKREFAFLEAEKRQLEQRIAEAEKEAVDKLASARGELDRLQGQVMAVSLEADRLADVMYQTEREAQALEQNEDVLSALLMQAAAALEKGGIKLPEIDAKAALEQKATQVGFAFEKAFGLLRVYSSVRKENGRFFALDGKQLEGTVVLLGQVASFGVSPEAAGALAPAGQDRLKLWPGLGATPSAQTARALADGKPPQRLGLFLYESLDKDIEAKKTQTLWEHVRSGGSIAWVIVVLGGLALIMILLRSVFLARAAANTDKLVESISPLLQRGEIDKAIDVCARAHSAAGRVLRATLRHISESREKLDDVISEAVLHEHPFLNKFSTAIVVTAAVAPLLGLLGTVTGMIATFDVITEYGTGNPKLLSGGISEALVTTELGLVVAIPTLLLGNLLTGWAESIKDDMDKAALRVTNMAQGVHVSIIPPPVATTGEPSLSLAR